MPDIFDVDDNQVAYQQLATRWRKEVQFAFVKAMIAPVRYTRGQFNLSRAFNLYVLAHNGQVCKLEGALNDLFDPVSRGIYITEPDFIDAMPLFRRIEEKPHFVAMRSELPVGSYPAPMYLRRRSELYAGSGVTFIVNVPSYIFFDMDRMKGLVNFYRLTGKQYKIEIV